MDSFKEKNTVLYSEIKIVFFNFKGRFTQNAWTEDIVLIKQKRMIMEYKCNVSYKLQIILIIIFRWIKKNVWVLI